MRRRRVLIVGGGAWNELYRPSERETNGNGAQRRTVTIRRAANLLPTVAASTVDYAPYYMPKKDGMKRPPRH